MTPIIGSILISLALGLAGICILCFSIFLKTKNYSYFLSGWRCSLSISLLVIFSTILLLNELITSNFDISYVAHYTSYETPIFYKFTALWAGQSGSLLFWLFVLSVYSLITLFIYRNSYSILMPWVIMVIVFIQSFFLLLVNFIENPFSPTEADFIVTNGNGLNPLLQNLTMAIHPPTLYLGYIGFTIPFAFAIASLITKYDGFTWIRSIRRWTLIAWMFQSMGIILGGWWAYQELGWGGYWAWDPVENASFMPWLTGTAFLHSIIVQEKRSMLKAWNMILIIMTFVLVIFGTFLTRSGIMSSVHSFAVSDLGPAFMIFILLLISICSILFWLRYPFLRTEKRIESFTSRESGFLLNNVVFVVICFSVFWGTIFPVLSEAIRGEKITVGAPFFNKVNAPIGLVLLFLTGVGPLLVWGRTSKKAFLRNFTTPILAGSLVFLICFLIEISFFAQIAFSLASFSIFAILKEFYRGTLSRINRFDESILMALKSLVLKNRSRYGGHLVHLGIVFMFIGFTGHAFDSETEFAIKVGEEKKFDGYKFKLESLKTDERPNHFAWIADLNVQDNEENTVVMLNPEKRIYFHKDPNPDKRQPHSELDIFSTVHRDIYAIFSGVDIDNKIAYMKIMINPLVWWVWLGGYILIAGTMISLWPKRNKQWI